MGTRVDKTDSLEILTARGCKYISTWLTVLRVNAYMSHKYILSRNSIGNGKGLEFYEATPLLHQVCAKHPTIHIPTHKQHQVRSKHHNTHI